MRIYQALDRHAGFCKLCWKWTEERMSHPVLIRGKNRKHVPDFATVERPLATEETLSAARERLKEIIAASKSSESNNPFLFAQLLHTYGVGYDRRIQFNQGRVVFDQGDESHEAQEMMLDRIEQNLIDELWVAQATQFGVKFFKPHPGDYRNAPKTPSRIFCPDHNPRRSIESRRRYQNDRKRITDFEAEVNRVYSQCIYQCIGIQTGDDHQSVRRVAYRNVFSSTLEKIKYLKAEGKKDTEIAGILKMTRQAVSNALRREKTRIFQP